MFSKRNWKVITSSVLAGSMLLMVAGCSKPSETEKTTTAVKTEATSKPTFKPDRTVTVVVPGGAGSSTDLLARAVEKVWSKYCPQPLQILNKGAAGGVEGATAVAGSKPDGYTLEIGYGGGQDIVAPHIQKVEYDPFKDLDPVARLSVFSVLVAAPANSPFNSLKDVVEWAKKEKKPVTAAVSLSAGAVDLAIRGFGKVAGIDVTPIPHTGGAQALNTLVGEQTLIGAGHPTEVLAQLKAKRIKALAIATPDRDPALKDVPTMKEQGINFSTWGSVKGVAIAKNTPPEIKAYYEDLFKKITDDADFNKSMEGMAQPVQYQNIADFTKFFKESYDDYGKIIKDLGLSNNK